MELMVSFMEVISLAKLRKASAISDDCDVIVEFTDCMLGGIFSLD